MQNRLYNCFPASACPVMLPIWLVSDATLGVPSKGSGEFTCDCALLDEAPTLAKANAPTTNATNRLLIVIVVLMAKSRNQNQTTNCCSRHREWAARVANPSHLRSR